jgi:hypothetical protein
MSDTAVRTDAPPAATLNRTVLGIGLVLASAFFFAASGPFAKAMYAEDWSPGAVSTSWRSSTWPCPWRSCWR